MLKIKIIFILLLTVVGVALDSSAAIKTATSALNKSDTTAGKVVDPKTITYSREVIILNLEAFDKKILNGDDNKNKISYLFYIMFANSVRGWLKSPWVELDTRIAKSWYINIYNSFVRMGKIKRTLERLELQHKDKTAVYKFQRKKFMVEYKKFKALQKKPTKLTKARYTELRRAQAIWEKKEREKAKAAARAKKRRR